MGREYLRVLIRQLRTEPGDDAADPVKPGTEPDTGSGTPDKRELSMPFVAFVNGLLLIGLAVLMGFDALLFPATRAIFLESGMLTLMIGGCICISTMNRRGGLNRLHSFLLTGTTWITAALAGALPLWLWDLSFTNAFFEAMSGITTTGSTVMTGLDGTEHGILLWRALLQWIGGVGFIVAGIALLPIMRVGGMQLFRTESSEKGEKAVASAARFAAATIWIYLALTFLCTLVYFSGGMTEFEAIAHALTTVSTGGYSTSDSSFGLFDSAYLQWMATLFMLAGALPFAWYIRSLNRGVVRSEQVRALVVMLVAVILALTGWRIVTGGTPVLETLRLVAFNVVSVVTTTGYATTDYTTWGPFAAAAFACLTAMGGCTGSTSGGAKMMRWILFVRSTRTQIKRIHQPHGIFPVRYEGRTVDRDVMGGVMTFFAFYGATVMGLAVALGFFGLDMTTSFSGALTAVANVGPGVGDIIGPAGNFATLPDGAKWLLAFGMYAGRLEMLTVYVLLVPAFWKEFS
ncbi:Trk system potassium uptake protein TrkH [Jannaschia seosinensis]|uniref:Trk system potassium uptake protein n=1 Tax=Jannaschia seosinensis TaxID=313367 RepID=A0A0M7B7Z3_9RHOB|nr:TrkH family potassium uptake protein [Jannaschia seosinensis]CUH38897.1 Trk system potassium uptake protein TrkH [Jannaschia seosinensis]